MKMRKSILSLAVSLSAVSLLFAGNVFAEGGVPTSESDSISPQAVVTATCSARRVSVASNFGLVSTASTAFVAIPDMSVTFVIPGFINVCLTVDYSGMTFAPSGALSGLMMVRSVLDGFVIGQPGEVQLDGDTDEDADGQWARSHNHQWVFTNVAPGVHTVTMQNRSFFGSTVFTHARTMTVHHK